MCIMAAMMTLVEHLRERVRETNAALDAAHADVKAAPANYPATAEQAMVKNDFAWMAANRERILAEWTRRYESKAQPKKK